MRWVRLVERAFEAMRRELGQTPKLFADRGASDRLETSIGLPYRVVVDLVLQGLAVIAAAPRS